MSDASNDNKKRFASLFTAINQRAAKADLSATPPKVVEVVNPKMEEFQQLVNSIANAAKQAESTPEEQRPMSPIDVFCTDVLDRLRKSVEVVPKALANIVKAESIDTDDPDIFAKAVIKMGHDNLRTAWLVSEYAKPAYVMLWRLTRQEGDRRMAAWYTRLSDRLREAHGEMCGPGYPFRHNQVLRMQDQELFGTEMFRPRMN